MAITERKGAGGNGEYTVEFEERDLEEVAGRLNRFKRVDEQPFEAVAAVSDFNQRAYELFAQPLVRSMSSELGAKVARQFHPLRAQRWAFSDLNPWLGWLAPAADAVRAMRPPPEENAANPLRDVEKAASEAVSASLDYYREMRDAVSEAMFFEVYGNVFSLYFADKRSGDGEAVAEARALPYVKEAIAAIDRGGYPEALARAASLLARHGAPLPLSWIETKKELLHDYRDLLPDLPPDAWRRIRGEQDIIVRYERARALATMPALLPSRADRDRLLELMSRLCTDERVQATQPTPEQV